MSRGQTITIEEFIAQARTHHGNAYDYSKVVYENTNKKVEIICQKHGSFFQIPKNHKKGMGCRWCAAEQRAQNRKPTMEKLLSDFRKIHGDKYDYSKVKYETSKEKIIIICPEHGAWRTSPNSHKTGHGCPDCGALTASRKRTHAPGHVIKAFHKVHGNKYDYSKVKYIRKDQKVKIVCPTHGEFWQRPNSHRRGHGCQKCFGNQRRTLEEVIERFRQIHGDKYDYSKVVYKHMNHEVILTCNEHGDFTQRPANHINREEGCPKCGIESRRLKRKKTLRQFIIDAREVHEDTYDYSKVEYVNTNIDVIIGCPEHGDFEQRPHVHIRGSSCPKCARKNSTESMFREVLEAIFSKFGEFKFPNTRPEWLRNPNTNYKLELDCYNKDLKLAFEFHGKQHFKPIEAWGGEKEYIRIRRRDQFTRFYCGQHGVTLVEIDGRHLTVIPKNRNRRREALKGAIENKLKNLRPDQKHKLMQKLKGDKA